MFATRPARRALRAIAPELVIEDAVRESIIAGRRRRDHQADPEPDPVEPEQPAPKAWRVWGEGWDALVWKYPRDEWGMPSYWSVRSVERATSRPVPRQRPPRPRRQAASPAGSPYTPEDALRARDALLTELLRLTGS